MSTNVNSIIPVVSQNFLYMNGLQVNRFSNTALIVSSGQCRDVSNLYDIVLSNNTTLDFTGRNGLNGLDNGTIAASTWYGVWAIGDPTNFNPSGVILSLASNSTPVMPFGYSAFRLIDFWRTDASSNFVQMFSFGNNGILTKQYSDPAATNVVVNGIAIVATNVSLAPFVPPSNVVDVKLSLGFVPNGGSNKFLTVGSPGSLSGFRTASIPGTTNTPTINVLDICPTPFLNQPNIYYFVPTNSDFANINCLGYRLIM